MSSFAEKPVQQRRTEVYRLLKKYPDKIPVIIQKDKSCSFETGANINKFLVPADLTVGQLIYTLRQRVKLSPEQALFIFLTNKLSAQHLRCGKLIYSTIIKKTKCCMQPIQPNQHLDKK